MKKVNFLLPVTLLLIFLQLLIFSGDNDTQMDLNAYAIWAGYGFFVLIALGFFYFLKYASGESAKLPQTHARIKDITNLGAINATAEIFSLFKYVTFLIISLLILYIVIIIILMA